MWLVLEIIINSSGKKVNEPGLIAQQSMFIGKDQALSKKRQSSNWPRKIGRGRKGISTKIHLALSPGGIQGACLSEGQRVDMKVFPKLWQIGKWVEVKYVIADKGYNYLSCAQHLLKKLKKFQLPQEKQMQSALVYKRPISLTIACVLQSSVFLVE